MTRSRITFLSHTAAPGGGELALSRYLRATSLDVELVTMEGGDVWKGLPCPMTIAPSLRQLRRVLRRGQGPVVANSMRAALYAALVSPRSRPLVYWVRDGLVDSAMSSTALAVTRWVTARRVRAYLANSSWTASTVRAALRVPPDRVRVVPSLSGVVEERISTLGRDHPGRPLRLLYLGRIARWKAPHVAVAAVGRLREVGIDVTLTIAGGALFGEDAYATQLSELVQDEPGAVMIGHVEDVPTLLSEHDILVHCSINPEPFGQVIVQGLGAGLPVLATHGGGPEEILQGCPVAALYVAGDPGALAEAVQAVLGDYRAASTWGVRRARELSDDRVAPETDQVIRSLPLD